MIFPNWSPSNAGGSSSQSLTPEQGTERPSFNKSNFTTDELGRLIFQGMPDVDKLKVNDPVIGYKLPREFADTTGEFITAVYSLKGESGTFTNPVLNINESQQYVVTYEVGDSLSLTIDNIAWSLFLLGHVTVSWIPALSRVKTDQSIECDTIIAKNALTLRETPVPKFQRPVNYGEDDTTWWMSWGYNKDSEEFAELLEGQPFIFEDRIFGLSYKLYKSGGTWTGSNVCISLAPEVSLHERENAQYLILWVKHSDVNVEIMKLLHLDSSHIAWDLTPYISMKMGDVDIKTNGWSKETHQTRDGYDGIRCEVKPDGLIADQEVDVIFKVNNLTLATLQYTASFSGSGSIVYPHNITDTVEVLGFFNNATIEPIDELKIYMLKAFTLPTEANRWDGVTNPLVYINNIDGYNITPDPSSSAALIAPYSLISNGVMLAENLESHTFKINDIGNDVVALTSRINSLTAEVQTLEVQLSEVEDKTGSMEFSELFEILELISPISFPFMRKATEPTNGEVGTATYPDYLKISDEGIVNVPSLTFTDKRPISSLAIDSESKNDNVSIPSTAWVNNKINSLIGGLSNGSVRFIDYLVSGEWANINQTIHDNIKKNEVLVFQTSYTTLQPLCVVVFPSSIVRSEGDRNQSMAFAAVANKTPPRFYVASITGTTESMAQTITWSEVSMSEVSGSTSTF